jgi:serine/threonine-protein kinase
LDVRTEAGAGYVRLAQVTGSGQGAQLGRHADAKALLAKAETVLRAAYVEAPQDPRVRRAMGDLLLEQAGQNLYNNNEIALGRRQTIEAQKILAPLATTDAKTARAYATAIQTEGDSHGWDGDNEEALPHFLRAEAFIAGLPPRLRDDTEVMKARSANLRLLGEAQHQLKDDARAIPTLDRAVAINEVLLARAPGAPEITRKLALSLWYRAVVLLAAGRTADGYASVDRSTALMRGLMARDPDDKGALQTFAIVGEVRAQALAELGRYAEADAMGREVVAAHRQIVARSENSAGARRSMAATLKTVGGNYYNGGRYQLACGAWDEARGIYLGLERAGKLTGHDRAQALTELERWMAGACDPPRKGLAGPV